jgi:two-component system cell cycle response regulator DivK
VKLVNKDISLANATVLVVDDNRDNLTALTDLLKLAGVGEVVSYPGGIGLIDFIESLNGPADLVLLDLQMPDLDGYTLLPRLRRLPRLQRAVFVAVTAKVMPDDVARARDVGFDAFIGKPLNPTRFPSQLARALRHETVWEVR